MLITCGVNHHTAPMSLRERLTFGPHHFPHSLYDLTQQAHVGEAAILSTCNRTEVYCKTAREKPVIEWLLATQGLRWEEVAPHLYVYKNEKVIKHILRVASGLDSMVVGEPQIFGQLKQAFSIAQAAGTLGKGLHPLFQYAFSTAKDIRSQTAVGRHPISFAYAIMVLAKRMFTHIQQKTVLLLGAGETIERMARYFHEKNVHKLIIANRTQEKAVALARRFGAAAIGLSDLEKQLLEADIVVSALHSPLPLLGKGLIERTLKKRKRRPQLLVDLGVPRNIEPEIASLEDAYLYCVDDLQQIIKEGLQHRQQAAQQAELLIDDYAHEFSRRMRARETTKMICAVRKKAEILRDKEVEKARQLLQKGECVEQVLQQVTTSLTNKLIHHPSAKLYQAGYDNEVELLEAAKYFFDMENIK
ncbi:MAG: glutamyl-tRNA reductase [Gammaproteobacteria bacterium]|nr:glutamyl-tRNA reductase [Gammaproteobacteria bacterium]